MTFKKPYFKLGAVTLALAVALALNVSAAAALGEATLQTGFGNGTCTSPTAATYNDLFDQATHSVTCTGAAASAMLLEYTQNADLVACVVTFDAYWNGDSPLFISNFVIVSVNCPVEPPSLCATDGRITLNCSAPAAVYCTETGFEVYSVDPDGNGTYAFSINPADYDGVSPESPLLVGSANGVEVYLLPSGEFQVHAYQADGKLYTFLWSSCTPGGDAEFSEYQ